MTVPLNSYLPSKAIDSDEYYGDDDDEDGGHDSGGRGQGAGEGPAGGMIHIRTFLRSLAQESRMKSNQTRAQAYF